MSSKEVLLVHPPSPMLATERMVPPYGHLQIAAILKDGGHKVSLLDVGEDKIDNEQLMNAQYLSIYATTPQYPGALKMVKPIMEKKQRRGLKYPSLSIAGPHASYMQENLIPDGWNHIIVGDGERIVIPLVEGEINKGVVYGQQVKNLDELPYPAYEYLDPTIYRRSEKHNTTYPAMTSRGCPYNCSFCGYTFIGRNVREHSIDYVIGLEKEIQNYGVGQVVHYDDTFTIKPKRVAKLSKGLEPLGMKWRANAHVNTIVKKKGEVYVPERDMLSAMRNGGCRVISVGVDGPDQKSLDYLKKNTELDRCEIAVEEIKRASILAKVFFIYIPGFGMKQVNNMKSFIERTEPDIVQLSTLMPLPGSDIYEDPNKYSLEFNKTRPESLYYQSREGEFSDVGILNEDDFAALDNFNEYLANWRKGRSGLPI